MKKLVLTYIIGIIGISLVVTGCSEKNKVDGSDSSQAAILEVKEANENTLQEMDDNEEKYIAEAEELIWKAFSFDVEAIKPKVDICDDLKSISYDITPTDFYVVEFQEESLYPQTLYHFCHLGEDEGFDLAEQSEEYFKEGMVEASTEFLKNIYGIDCSDAEIHAYGYANKIAVQIEVAPDQIFQVKFYYQDMEPVGVQFCSDISGFDRMMEVNQAKKYF